MPFGLPGPVMIRSYRQSDAPHLSALYRRTVQQIGPRDYNAAQVAAWADLAPTPERLHALMADGRVRLVAAVSEKPVAFADLEANDHIHFLYAAPEATGTGIVTMLYERLEDHARQARLSHLHAEASEAARRFFLKQGFAVLARRDFTVAGAHNYAVEKRLAD